MGNSQTKEARGHPGSHGRQDSQGASTGPGRDVATADPAARPVRPRRGSRSDLSTFLGIGGSTEQDTMTLEQRREAKLEREAKKAEKEKQTRLRERERSMRDEHVDGGYLVTQGVYVGAEDYSKIVVRSLMIERRLAPFWRGLNDYSESWAEHQLVAAGRGMPIPPADHVPPELERLMSTGNGHGNGNGNGHTTATTTSSAASTGIGPEPGAMSESNKDRATGVSIPGGSRLPSFQVEPSLQWSPANSSLPLPSTMPPSTPSPPTGPLFRARARTLAGLTSSRTLDPKDAALPKEFQLPPDPFVNGQPIEVYLYKDACECPICFLYYPPYLNTTRCCEQAICSECFVQIKRPDPHQPEHEQPDPNAAQQMSEEDQRAQSEGLLVSEVATCPYCKQPEFGITYSSPPFRRGLTYGPGAHPFQAMSAMSSQTSFSSGQMSPGPNRRRGTSLSATAPEVVTTDKVRPDWASKLATARAHAARRSAAASALHAAAYLMNGQNERPTFPPFGRRHMLRRPTLEGSDDRAPQVTRELDGLRDVGAFFPPHRVGGSRRNRVDDLEEMMLSEAIRLSLAAEEERLRKEEKEAKKKAKKDGKEQKKAEKAARKNQSWGASTSFGESAAPMVRSGSVDSSMDPDDPAGKGKGIDRPLRSSFDGDDLPVRPRHITDAPLPPGADAPSLGVGDVVSSSSEPFKRSHLRQMSNASSAASSFIEAGTSLPAGGTPTGNAGLEPLFNFRSLTAMINDHEKGEGGTHVEHTGDGILRPASFEDLEHQASTTSTTTGINSQYGGKQGTVAVHPASDAVEDGRGSTR